MFFFGVRSYKSAIKAENYFKLCWEQSSQMCDLLYNFSFTIFSGEASGWESAVNQQSIRVIRSACVWTENSVHWNSNSIRWEIRNDKETELNRQNWITGQFLKNDLQLKMKALPRDFTRSAQTSLPLVSKQVDCRDLHVSYSRLWRITCTFLSVYQLSNVARTKLWKTEVGVVLG